MTLNAKAAAARRDAAYGAVLTYSPKVFLPVTNLCRNHCSYCTFRRSPNGVGAHTMTPEEVCASLDAAAAAGCIEALLCLGDTPETGFPSYQRTLHGWGFENTVDYLDWIGRQALQRGLFAHTNAGLLDASAMSRLKRSNLSLGLMLESNADRLCQPGMPHAKAPDKQPAKRRAMIAQAGRLKIPFTSGILVGFGETKGEREEAIEVLADLHHEHGHLQELIIQPFRPHASTAMADATAASDQALLEAVAFARLCMPSSVTIQAPPNLASGAIEALIDAGINDFGGISPLTPDFINPNYAWPHLETLAERCAAKGFSLQPRLPVHAAYLQRPGWIDEQLLGLAQAAQSRLGAAA
jgi:FO synthase